MRIRFVFALLAIVGASSVSAAAETYYLSEPNLCQADDGVLEEMGVIYLTKTGINSHSFGCEWPLSVGRKILRGQNQEAVKAKCASATDIWNADLEIVHWDKKSLRVFQEKGGISPVRFFRCN